MLYLLDPQKLLLFYFVIFLWCHFFGSKVSELDLCLFLWECDINNAVANFFACIFFDNIIKELI